MITRKTKILAKIADNRSEVDFLKSVFGAGADVAWLNTAHQDEEATLKVVENIRAVSNLIPIAIDTKGPEVRTKDVETPLEIKKGDHVVFSGDLAFKGKNVIRVTYPNFHNEIPVGEVILYDDALIEFIAVEKMPKGVKCVVNNAGLIKNKKSLNVPNVHIKLPALSEKDKGFIHFCAKNNIDFITHSFMRSKADIAEIRKITDTYPKYNPKIIAKIENREGFKNVRDILKHCDGLMVARGDLGAEVGLENVPYMQKKMVEACLEMGKYCIVATQALESMIKNPRPTRAEVSDIANAVIEGTGAMSMSGETAYGDHPVEATAMMAKVMKATEATEGDLIHAEARPVKPSKTFKAAEASLKTAMKADAAVVVALGCDIEFIRGLSAYRPETNVVAASSDEEIVRELRMAYAIAPVLGSGISAKAALAAAKFAPKPSDKVCVIEAIKKTYKTSVKAFKDIK
ncbi:MAG TPA: pyruvate kinase [Candidatus Paceibacterota bacterium]|nr:pyruvate kinase [Candidatus Paceibacterota bacterium]